MPSGFCETSPAVPGSAPRSDVRRHHRSPRRCIHARTRRMSADQAQDYHTTQIATLARADVDLVEALTFNSVSEAIGVPAPQPTPDFPASISFTLDGRPPTALGSDPARKRSNPSTPSVATTGPPSTASTVHIHSSSSLQSARQLVRASAMPATQRSHDGQDRTVHIGPSGIWRPRRPRSSMGEIAQQYPHIDIWGGCCGTWETHLDEIAKT